MSFVDNQISHEYIKYRGSVSRVDYKRIIARSNNNSSRPLMIKSMKDYSRSVVRFPAFCSLARIVAPYRFIYSHFEYYWEIGCNKSGRCITLSNSFTTFRSSQFILYMRSTCKTTGGEILLPRDRVNQLFPDAINGTVLLSR